MEKVAGAAATAAAEVLSRVIPIQEKRKNENREKEVVCV